MMTLNRSMIAAIAITTLSTFLIVYVTTPGAQHDTFQHYDRRSAPYIDCSQEPRTNTSSIAVVTLLSDVSNQYFGLQSMLITANDQYLLMAKVLAYSLRTFGRLPCQVPLVMLVADDVKLDVHRRRELEWFGWQLRSVQHIAAPDKVSNSAFEPRFKKLFTKLRIFDLDEFESVLYLDCDTMIVSDVRPIFDFLPTMKFLNLSVAMSYNKLILDSANDKFKKTPLYQAGVILLRPQKNFVKRMVFDADTMNYNVYWSEQGFLSSYFDKNVYILPYIYNVLPSTLITESGRQYWQYVSDRAVIVHYTVTKQWDVTGGAGSGFVCWLKNFYELCDLWHATKNQALDFYETSCKDKNI